MGQRRGSHLLLVHCARLQRITAPARPTAKERLEAALGAELARALLGALSGSHSRQPPAYLL